MDKNSLSLSFNCGYARVAALEYSFTKRGKPRSSIDRAKRIEMFQKLFRDRVNFTRPTEFWSMPQNETVSTFNRYCDSVLDDFVTRWKPKEHREEYKSKFSTENWKALPKNEKIRHSMSKCSVCAEKHIQLQKSFPRLPCFDDSLIQIPLNESEASVTRRVLADLNGSYNWTFNHSFTESILMHCGTSEGITVKETKTVKKRKRRDLQQNICLSVNKSFRENAAINFLASKESFSGYQRKRLAQSFDKCEVSKPKKHRITDSQFTQYNDIVVQKLSDWPQDEPMIWSKLGSQCGLTTSNRGQIVKSIAEESGIDIKKRPHNAI